MQGVVGSSPFIHTRKNRETTRVFTVFCFCCIDVGRRKMPKGQQKVNKRSTAPFQIHLFCCAGKRFFMANFQANRKNGKIVSFRFRVFIGRDKTGRQQFKTKVWKPDKDYTEKRLLKLAEAEAALWEREIMQEDCVPIYRSKPQRTFYLNIASIWYVNGMPFSLNLSPTCSPNR